MSDRAPDLVSARHAVAADTEITAELSLGAQQVARDERGGALLLDHDRELVSPREKHLGACSSPQALLVVGMIDDTVVGYAHAELSKLTAPDAGRLCMIDELIVHPDARAIGVGSAILEAVELWARATSCVAIESQVLPGNRAAKNFFERVGMKTRKMRVSAPLN